MQSTTMPIREPHVGAEIQDALTPNSTRQRTTPQRLALNLRGGGNEARPLTLLTININGLRSPGRLTQFLRTCKSSRYDIILVQEHHLDEGVLADAQHSADIFGFHGLFSSEPSGAPSGGVAFLVRTSTTQLLREDLRLEVIHPGRAAILQIKSPLPLRSILNIHAPNAGRPEFFDEIQRHIQTLADDPGEAPHMNIDSLFIAGDFNCVTNTRLDLSRPRITPSAYDNSGAPELQELISLLDLHDIFRTQHPEGKRFTWGLDSVHRPKVRLDRWYTPIGHIFNIETQVDGTWLSDHVGVTLTLTSPDEPPKRGGQVRNSRVILSVLDDPRVERELHEAMESFFPLSPTTTMTFSQDLPSQAINPQLTLHSWGNFKSLVSSILIQASKDLRNRRHEGPTHRTEILEELSELTEFLSGHEDPAEQGQGLIDELQDLRASLAQADSNALKTSTGRRALARLQQQTHGTSQFFLSLVHIQNDTNGIKSLFQESDWSKPPSPEEYDTTPTASSPTEIMQAATSYYEWLFSAKAVCPVMIEKARRLLARRTLPTEAQLITDAEMTPRDVHDTLSTLRDKGPGPDSIPNLFWKKYKDKMSFPLAKMFQAAIACKRFHPTTTQGAITLLYKKKDRRNIRNYRPITLLNTDYKIFTIILNSRLKQVIHHIAGQENTGFIPHRFIIENAHLLNMLRARSEELASKTAPPLAQYGAAFVSLDQEKAFDRAAWEYLDMALPTLKFGQRFIDSIGLMYNPAHPPTRQLRINGFLSHFFPILSGVPQGCAASPLIYIIFTETLTRMVNNDRSWSGIPFIIPGTPRRPRHRGMKTVPHENPRRSGTTEIEIKIVQYADDTVLAISHPHYGLPRAMQVVNNYLQATAGKLNIAKCEGFLCGHARDSPPHAGFEWAADGDYIISLGLPHGSDFDTEHFWLEIIDNIAQSLSRWRLIRHLIPQDRVAGFQGLIKSKLIYPLQFLPITSKILMIVNNLMNRMIWESQPIFHSAASTSDTPTLSDPLPHLGKFGGRRWVAKSQATNKPIDGGIKIPELERTVQAIRTRWLFRYLDASEGDWKTPLDHWILPRNDNTLRRGIIISNHNTKYIIRRLPLDLVFLRQALQLPPNARFVPQEIKSREEALAEPIFRSLRFRLPRQLKSHIRLMEHRLDCWTIADLWNHSGKCWWSANDMLNFLTLFDDPNPPEHATMEKILRHLHRALPRRLVQLVEDNDHSGHDHKNPTILDISPHLHAPPDLIELTTDNNGNPCRAFHLFLTVTGVPIRTKEAGHHTPPSDLRGARVVHSVTKKGITYVYGAAERSYPHHDSWHLQLHSRSFNFNSAARITSVSKGSRPPASVAKWSKILHRKLTARQIFRVCLKPSVLTGKDRNTRFKLLHRALILNRRRPSPESGTRCRLCLAHQETHLHLVACCKIRPVWSWVFDVISELEGKKITPTVTKCIFGIIPDTHKERSLSPGSITMLDLTWKIIYWHLWRETIDEIPFQHQQAIASIVERLHNAIQGHEAKHRRLYRQGKNPNPFAKSSPMIKGYCPVTSNFILHPVIANAFEEHGWSQQIAL